MKKEGLCKIIFLVLLLFALYWLYNSNITTVFYKAFLQEGIKELLKHFLIELVEHIRG